jgi:hypothetical protein
MQSDKKETFYGNVLHKDYLRNSEEVKEYTGY